MLGNYRLVEAPRACDLHWDAYDSPIFFLVFLPFCFCHLRLGQALHHDLFPWGTLQSALRLRQLAVGDSESIESVALKKESGMGCKRLKIR